MAGIFNNDRTSQGGATLVAPGTPLGALSGNPAATVTNLAAMAGGEAGAMFGNALNTMVGQAIGAPLVDPMAIRQSNAAAYADLYEQEIQNGVMPGQASINAASKARREGYISEDQFLQLTESGVERRDKDREFLGEAIDNFNRAQEIKDFRQIKTNYMAMIELAQQKPSKVSDYMFVVNMLKATDPTSVNSQNEITATGKAIMGKRNVAALLGVLGFSLENITSFIANKGRPETFSAEQKAAAIQALGAMVEQRAGAAQGAYQAQFDRFNQLGGNTMPFELATNDTRSEILDFNAAQILKDNRAAFTNGNSRPYHQQLQVALNQIEDRSETSIIGGSKKIVGQVLQLGTELGVEEGLSFAEMLGVESGLFPFLKNITNPELSR